MFFSFLAHSAKELRIPATQTTSRISFPLSSCPGSLRSAFVKKREVGWPKLIQNKRFGTYRARRIIQIIILRACFGSGRKRLTPSGGGVIQTSPLKNDSRFGKRAPVSWEKGVHLAVWRKVSNGGNTSRASTGNLSCAKFRRKIGFPKSQKRKHCLSRKDVLRS